jgi:ketosteroid isomerase-like protein
VDIVVIVRRAGALALSVALFLLVWSLYRPSQGAWTNAPSWGNAPTDVRAAVMARLGAFQEGYLRRDPAAVDAFVRDLFSTDHPLVLGTMPREIFSGTDRVRRLVADDWSSWGDCRFRLAETQVSSAGDVAWFAPVGSVKFDLSRFLILPLRLTGVMVKEGGVWTLRQAQFQFDLDLAPLLLLDGILLAWIAVNVARLCLAIVWRPHRSPQAAPRSSPSM